MKIPPADIKVMVAHGDPALRTAMRVLLTDNGFNVALARDGFQALQLLEIEFPRVAILDVALPGMYGFEILDFIRSNDGLRDIKVVLLASIYHKTRYKRTPTSLYGADDYIEIHHISDSLVPIVSHLFGVDARSIPGKEWTPPVQVEVHPQVRDISRGIEDKVLPLSEMDDAHKKARNLARLIVSDIALYNQELIEKGVREGTFYELLKDDIREGEGYYSKRVSPEILKQTVYLKDAFEELIEKIRKRLGV
ncbi:MAG: response regulator [Deltaproteobacteria bacterium]|nr:response regulator [Deltaproteobacteria bacterium]